MKVCLLNDSFPPVIDGVATAVTNYATIMTESGRANVLVGTPRYPDADYSKYPYQIVPYQSFDTPDIADGYRAGNPLAIKEINEMAQFQPDLIHVHCPAASAVVGRILRNETNAPIVFTYHTKYDIDIARAIKSKHIQKEVIKAMIANISASDEVWTVSQGAGDSLHALGYEGEIRVVSNGVDFAKGRAENALITEATKDFDLPEGVPVFLFVGRIIKYKGLPLILDAMRRLSEQGMNYRMIFIGSGVDAPELQQTIRENHISLDIRQEDGQITHEAGTLPGKIIFTGAIYDRNMLRAWNTRADLFIFPSTYDTNGIVVREAAACGLASVLIQGSCAAEGITHARNGYLVEETGKSIAALLAEVAPHPEQMHRVGQCAMDEIYISWEDSVMRAVDRYQMILEMKHAGTLKPRRNGKSDKFLSMTADVMTGLYDIFHAPETFRHGMLENFAEAEKHFSEKKSSLRNNLHEIHQEIKEKKQEWKEELGETWTKLNGSKK